MGQVLHGSATTTEAVRRAIQHSQESLRALAKRNGLKRENHRQMEVEDFRFRSADGAQGAADRRSFSVEEEAVVVAFRRHTLLPLDDCLYALQPTIPHLTRSSLHRCLQQPRDLPVAGGRRRSLRQAENSRLTRSAIFISTSPKSEPRRANSICSLQSTEPRSSPSSNCMRKWLARTAGDFLRRLIDAVPYKVHTVLTDNGTHFTTPGNASSAAPDIKAALEAGELVWAHAFEYAAPKTISTIG